MKANSVRNAGFFKEHYAIAESEFYKTSYGHCVSEIVGGDKKRFMRNHNTACKHWQPIKTAIIERREILKDTLYSLSEKLKEISLILEHDRHFNN